MYVEMCMNQDRNQETVYCSCFFILGLLLIYYNSLLVFAVIAMEKSKSGDLQSSELQYRELRAITTTPVALIWLYW